MSKWDEPGFDYKKLSPEELDDYIKILKEYDAQENRLNPLSGFVPNGAQEALIKAVGDPGENKWIIYLMPAANSLGKTAVAISILANAMWGPQNRWFDLPRFREWPKDWPKAAWYISEQSVLKDTICGVREDSDCEIRKWFPKGRYSFTKSGYEYYSELTTDTGWSVSFKTYDQDVTKFAGKKISIAIFDEPPPEAIFNEVLARLLTGGVIIMPMTPLYTAAWTAERLVENKDGSTWVLPSNLADIDINSKEKGIRGWLDDNQINIITSKYDEDERAARKSGSYMYLSGLVYKGIHPDTHYHDIEDFDQDQYTIYNVVDPHTVKPDCIGWYAIDKETGYAYGIGEFPTFKDYGPFHLLKNTDLTTKDFIQKMIEFEQDHGWDPTLIRRVMDPNYGHTKKGDAGLTTQALYKKLSRDAGYPMRYSCDVNDSEEAGERVVKQYLATEKIGDETVTRFKFHRTNCRNMYYQMTHFKFVKAGQAKVDRDGATERVEKKYKDFCDTTRYFLMFAKHSKATHHEEEEPLPEHYCMYKKPVSAKKDWRDPDNI